MAKSQNQVDVVLKLIADQFKKEMTETNRLIADSNKAFRYLQNELKHTGTESQKLEASVRKSDAAYKLQTDNVKAAEEALKEYDAAQAQTTEAYEKARKELAFQQDKLQRFGNELYEAKVKQAIHNDELYKGGKALEDFGTKAEKQGKKLENLGNKLSIVSGIVMGIGGVSVKAFTDFESAFAGVRKTVDATEEEYAVISDGIKEMSKHLPTSAKDIAAVTEAAGQLGIQKDALLDFTGVMIDLGESTNMNATEGASQLARFANITNMSQKDFRKLGSTIVDLGNNFATTEAEIVDMGLRIAGAGKQVGMSEAEIMGFATALSSVGIESQAGGSAISKLMINMAVAAETGETANKTIKKTGYSLRDLQMMSSHNSKGFGELAYSMGMTTEELQGMVDASGTLKGFSEVTGKSAEEFKKAFQEDAAGAIQEFISGLSTAEERGLTTIGILDDMGIKEIRLRDTILRATGAKEMFVDALDTATTAWGENNALTKEAEQRYKTQESQIEMTKNKINLLMIEIGEKLLPIVAKGMEYIDQALQTWNDMDDATKDQIISIGKFVAVAGPAIKVLGVMTTGVGKTATGLGRFMQAMGKARATASVAKPAIEGASKTMGLLEGTTANATKSLVFGLNPAVVGITVGIGAAVAVGAAWAQINGEMNEKTVRTKENTSFLTEAFMALRGEVLPTREELEKQGVLYDELSSDLSPEFQKAVEESTDKMNEFKIALGESGLDGVFTSEESDALLRRVESTFDSIIASMDSKRGSMELENLFGASGDGISRAESVLVDYYSKIETIERNKVSNIQISIKQIIDKARSENRTLTAEERGQIEKYYADLNQIELELQAKNEAEKEYAENKYRARQKSVDRDTASEFIKEQKVKLDTSLELAEDNYKKALRLAEDARKNGSKEQKLAANLAIEEAEKQYKAEQDKAKKHWDDTLGIMREYSPGVMEYINEFNGDLLSQNDLFAKKELNTLKTKYKGLANITKSGTYDVFNAETGHWERMTTLVDNATGEITGIQVRSQGGSIIAQQAYSESMEKDLEQLAFEFENTYGKAGMLARGLSADVGRYGTITASNLESLMVSVTKMKDKVTGLEYAIIDVNGTPVRVDFNPDGTIRNVNDLLAKLREIDDNSRKNVSVNVNANKAMSDLDRLLSQIRGVKSKTITVKANTQFTGQRAGSISSHFAGVADVPYNDYFATLHKGERVLTASENANYNQASVDRLAKVIDSLNARIARAEIAKSESTSVENVTNQTQNFNGTYQFMDDAQMKRFWDYGSKMMQRGR